MSKAEPYDLQKLVWVIKLTENGLRRAKSLDVITIVAFNRKSEALFVFKEWYDRDEGQKIELYHSGKLINSVTWNGKKWVGTHP